LKADSTGFKTLKVLVVDDEHIIRSWISLVIERNYNGNIQIMKTSSGEQALEYILNGDVDIAITDIRMKRMSGLDLINSAKKAGVITKFILISNYEEFSYAKEAIRLGASDYLLKSEICDEDIINALERVKSEIEMSNNPDKQNSSKDMYSKKKHFIEQLLKGKFREFSEEWLQERAKQFSILLRPENLFVIVIDADNKVDSVEEEDKYNSQMADAIIQNLHIWFEGGEWVKIGASKYTVVLNVSSNSNKTKRELLDLFALKIISEMKSRVNINVSVGISRSFKGLSRISEEYENANAALKDRFFTSGSSIRYYLDIDNRQFINYNNYIQSSINKIREYLNLWKFDDAIKETKELLSDIPCMHIPNHHDVQQALVRIASIYYNSLNTLGIHSQDIENLFYGYQEKITACSLYRDASYYIMSILEDLPRTIAEVTNNSDVVDHVAEYIKTNYNEDLSLTSLSELFHISAGHLSKKFKKKTGKNISKYIIDMRIEASKELLKSSELKVSDIATRVGFSSVSYLAQVFKKVEGCSPQTYRMDYHQKTK
jgi:two-component system response regulator YesN